MAYFYKCNIDIKKNVLNVYSQFNKFSYINLTKMYTWYIYCDLAEEIFKTFMGNNVMQSNT